MSVITIVLLLEGLLAMMNIAIPHMNRRMYDGMARQAGAKNDSNKLSSYVRVYVRAWRANLLLILCILSVISGVPGMPKVMKMYLFKAKNSFLLSPVSP